jgi:hypothetical protein
MSIPAPLKISVADNHTSDFLFPPKATRKNFLIIVPNAKDI